MFCLFLNQVPDLKLSLESKLVKLKEGNTFEFTCSVDDQNAINYLMVSKDGVNI